jgi:uncharacterized membrane protein YdcZ (DUF606 family)
MAVGHAYINRRGDNVYLGERMYIVYLVLALTAGCFIVLQRNYNMRLAQNVGVAGSNLLNYTVGFFFAIIIYVVALNLGVTDFSYMGELHSILILAAICGVFIVLLSNWLVPKATAITFTIFTLIGQCLSSLGFDLFIFKKEITMTNIIGAVIVIFGIVLYNYEKD